MSEKNPEQENLLEEEQKQHRHHHHHRKKSKIKPVIYCVTAFFLSVTLFLTSACAVVELTVFSKDYMLDRMDSSGYYSMVKYELQNRLKNLGDASGFEASFAQNFVDSYDVKKAVQNYIQSFYAGDSTLVETTEFKQQLYAAVQNYAAEKNITLTDEINDHVAYFINEAANIYVDQIAIPFFSVIGVHIVNAQNSVNILLISLGVLVLIIAAVIFFTNEFKHRRYRYLCYGLLGGALTTAVLPTVVLLSDKITRINIATRSLYNLIVSYFNNIFYAFYIPTAVMAALAVVTFVMYAKYYSKYRNQ